MSDRSRVVIVAAKRTPMGGMQGDFASLEATDLGAAAMRATLDQIKHDATQIDEVYFGNVVSAGLGQAPARIAALKAGIAQTVSCTTVNKVCGSGMKAAMIATDQIQAGNAEVVLAGGMESMSNTPFLLAKARAGLRLGHAELIDSLFKDGLENGFAQDQHDAHALMGVYAQHTADKFALTRQAMDDYAMQSLMRANHAINAGYFVDEIAPVSMATKLGEQLIEHDQQPVKAKAEKIPLLKPAFRADGTITAANASSMSDGAAALLLMNEQSALAQGYTPLASIVAHVSSARAPSEFCLAPIDALRKVLNKSSWSAQEVDCYEINEAFAAVSLLAIKELALDQDKVNIHGGACALGHPLGASGARILVTLIHALQRLDQQKGVAALCIGGGEATAMAIELA